MQYQPKGGMCAGCEHKNSDCSKLPFERMRVIDRACDVAIVKCDEYRPQPAKGG